TGRAFVDLGFSPTLVSRSRFDGRELGGHFHFTSSLSVGASFGRFDRYALSLRAQHTSNGGLNEDNPGLDMVGVNFTVRFANF
ncbi:MAG: acyloxyacyl hydrolase, partial [Pseudomonadota bacterium]